MFNFLLILTLFNLKKRNITKMKWNNFQLTGLSVTSGQDQLVALHLRGGNDFVISLISNKNANRVGELVGNLLRQYHL